MRAHRHSTPQARQPADAHQAIQSADTTARRPAFDFVLDEQSSTSDRSTQTARRLLSFSLDLIFLFLTNYFFLLSFSRPPRGHACSQKLLHTFTNRLEAYGAGGGIRTHEGLRHRVLSPRQARFGLLPIRPGSGTPALQIH